MCDLVHSCAKNRYYTGIIFIASEYTKYPVIFSILLSEYINIPRRAETRRNGQQCVRPSGRTTNERLTDHTRAQDHLEAVTMTTATTATRRRVLAY